MVREGGWLWLAVPEVEVRGTRVVARGLHVHVPGHPAGMWAQGAGRRLNTISFMNGDSNTSFSLPFRLE